MLQRFKPLIVFGCCLAFSLWWFLATNRTAESYYTREEYYQDLSKIYSDLGQASYERNDLKAAIDAYKEAITLDPSLLKIYDRIGICYEQQGDLDNATKTYFKAMSISSAFVAVRSDKTPLQISPPSQAILDKSQIWQGQPIEGKTLYVVPPQSVSQTIQYARFLPRLAQRGARVLFQPHDSITKLFKQSDLDVTILDKTADLSGLSFDYYLPLTSVPCLLNSTYQNIATNKPYLKVSREQQEQAQQVIKVSSKLAVGLVWQSDDPAHSIPLSMFFGITHIRNIQYYALQGGSGIHELEALPPQSAIINLSKYLNDGVALAAIIQNLDLVITVDSAIAHLSGALGKAVWLLLPHVSEWSWFDYSEQTSSIWYPSIKKFQQPTPGNWASVFRRLHHELVLKVS